MITRTAAGFVPSNVDETVNVYDCDGVADAELSSEILVALVMEVMTGAKNVSVNKAPRSLPLPLILFRFSVNDKRRGPEPLINVEAILALAVSIKTEGLLKTSKTAPAGIAMYVVERLAANVGAAVNAVTSAALRVIVMIFVLSPAALLAVRLYELPVPVIVF